LRGIKRRVRREITSSIVKSDERELALGTVGGKKKERPPIHPEGNVRRPGIGKRGESPSHSRKKGEKNYFSYDIKGESGEEGRKGKKKRGACCCHVEEKVKKKGEHFEGHVTKGKLVRRDKGKGKKVPCWERRKKGDEGGDDLTGGKKRGILRKERKGGEKKIFCSSGKKERGGRGPTKNKGSKDSVKIEKRGEKKGIISNSSRKKFSAVAEQAEETPKEKGKKKKKKARLFVCEK